MSNRLKTVVATGGYMFQAVYQGTTQNVSVSSSNARSNAVGANTTLVRIICDTDVWVNTVGTTNTAAVNGTNSFFLPANTPEYFGIEPSDQIAFITTSASGTANIMEAAMSDALS